MKGKILNSFYNPGYNSWVQKQTKYGIFDSEVFLQEEDKELDNSFDGCRIAEFDCDLKAYKEKAKRMHQRAIGARTLYNNLAFIESFVDYDDRVYEQVLYLEREAKKAREYYERMKDYRPIFIRNLLTKRKAIRNRHKK